MDPEHDGVKAWLAKHPRITHPPLHEGPALPLFSPLWARPSRGVAWQEELPSRGIDSRVLMVHMAWEYLAVGRSVGQATAGVNPELPYRVVSLARNLP